MKEIEQKFNELVRTIAEYESDTFSSSASEITEAEAQQIAYIFICRDIQRRIDTESMDGVIIDEELYILRDTEE